MRHTSKKRVPFGHSDPARIVYYPRFFEWFHDAFEEMFEAVIGESYAEIIRTHGVGYPAVQVACEFRGPARWGDMVDVEVFLSRLSDRSATFEYRVRRDAKLLVTASVKIATMSMTGHQAAPMPEGVRAALQPFVESDDVEVPDSSRIR